MTESHQRKPFYLQVEDPREEQRIEVEVEVRPKIHNTFKPDGSWREDGHVFRTNIPGHEGLLSTGTHKLWVYESDLPVIEAMVEDREDVLDRARQRCQRRVLQQVRELLGTDYSPDDPEHQAAFDRVMQTHGMSVEAEFQDIMDAEYGERRGVKRLTKAKPTGETAPPPVDRQVGLVQQTVREVLGAMQGGGDAGEVSSLRKENAELKDRLDRLEAALGEKPSGGGKRGKSRGEG